jgi:hypothetical protein
VNGGGVYAEDDGDGDMLMQQADRELVEDDIEKAMVS